MTTDLVAADITVTINSPKDMTRRRKINHVTMDVGDGASVIPALGLLPLPAKSTFGMAVIDDMIILGGGLGYVIEYDSASHSLIWYFGDDTEPNAVAAGEAPAASTIRALVIGR